MAIKVFVEELEEGSWIPCLPQSDLCLLQLEVLLVGGMCKFANCVGEHIQMKRQKSDVNIIVFNKLVELLAKGL